MDPIDFRIGVSAVVDDFLLGLKYTNIALAAAHYGKKVSHFSLKLTGCLLSISFLYYSLLKGHPRQQRCFA